MIVSTNNLKTALSDLNQNGFNTNILSGPNTINEITITNYTLGLANYMKKNNMKKIVIGYDSRINSKNFSLLITKIFYK